MTPIRKIGVDCKKINDNFVQNPPDSDVRPQGRHGDCDCGCPSIKSI